MTKRIMVYLSDEDINIIQNGLTLLLSKSIILDSPPPFTGAMSKKAAGDYRYIIKRTEQWRKQYEKKQHIIDIKL